MSGWIKCSDRLPEKSGDHPIVGDPVLAVDRFGVISTGCWMYYPHGLITFNSDAGEMQDVPTHWMPLPAPPAE